MANGPLSKSGIGPDVLLRALGVSLIVLDHATYEPGRDQVLAGLNVLLIVAGWSFARFLPPSASPAQIRSSLLTYGLGVAVPSLWVLGLSIIVYQLRRAPGLHDWAGVDLSHVALFPAWYPLELVGALAILAAVYSLPAVARLQAERPFVAGLGFVALAVAHRGVQSVLFRTGALDADAPHLMLWNLTAGMMLFAASQERRRSLRFLAMLIVALLCWVTWGPFMTRTWTTLGAAALLLATTRLTVPFALGRLLLVLSQASLFIFLLHIPALRLFNGATASSGTTASFVVALTGCAAVWVVWTAGSRAMRRRVGTPRRQGA